MVSKSNENNNNYINYDIETMQEWQTLMVEMSIIPYNSISQYSTHQSVSFAAVFLDVM